MRYSEDKMVIDLLYQPKYSLWRHLFILVAIISTTLSQSFFVFGKSTAIATSTIYLFGMGVAACLFAIIYFNVYHLASYFLSKKAYVTYAFVLLLIVIGLIAAKGIAEFWVFAHAGIYRQWNGISLLDGISNTLLYTICVASTSITILFRQLMADHTKIENLQNKQLKSSIDEIKNRVHPQFLYATLANASERVKHQPQQVTETLFALSELLRYQLYDSTGKRVLLSSDIAFVRNYLQLHQQNSGHLFSFELFVDGDTNKLVPPALFTACIEEVLSYQPQELQLTITIQETCIEVKCKASGIKPNTNNLSQTEQKLRLIYGNEMSLEHNISQTENGCYGELQVILIRNH